MMNIQKMMKQAQQMQAKMTEMQAILEQTEYEGSAASGMVKATLNGKGHLLRLSVDPSLIDPAESDVLEDLIIAAHNDAKSKADQAATDEMGKLTGGLQLPAGMKLPF